MTEVWHGFDCEVFEFEGMEARVVLPSAACGRLAVKTEYWDAFPDTEIALVRAGFHLAYIKNGNRWGTDDDLDRKARFVRYVSKKYGVGEKCVPVGMSCGGLIAVKFAARYPGLVSCLYLDAPVVNYMSCPCGFGSGGRLHEKAFAEIMGALGLNTVGELLAYRDMPLDRLPELVRNRIPCVLVAGDSDKTVPFDENGLFVQRAYRAAGVEIETYVKPGCDHHPHGLSDPAPVVRFILAHRG